MKKALILARKTDCNTKVTEIEGKIPSNTGLATAAALNFVENQIPNLVIQSRKQIIMQIYLILTLDIRKGVS